jgi:hypothetical protein
MKNFIACLCLLLVCSCAVPNPKPEPQPQPQPTPGPITPNLDPRMAVFSNNSMIQTDTVITNRLYFQWIAPTMDGLIGYNFYYGTSSNNYISSIRVGLDTNITIITLDQLIDPGKDIYATTLPNGMVVTNISQLFFAVSALYDPTLGAIWLTNADGNVESELSTPTFWPPPPPPPWSAVVLSWGNTSRNVTVLGTANFKSPAWNTLTNVTGTNVLLPLSVNLNFIRAFTPDNPPIKLQIQGAYINGTN